MVDKTLDSILQSKGFRILRFCNRENVFKVIAEEVKEGFDINTDYIIIPIYEAGVDVRQYSGESYIIYKKQKG